MSLWLLNFYRKLQRKATIGQQQCKRERTFLSLYSFSDCWCFCHLSEWVHLHGKQTVTSAIGVKCCILKRGAEGTISSQYSETPQTTSHSFHNFKCSFPPFLPSGLLENFPEFLVINILTLWHYLLQRYFTKLFNFSILVPISW